MPRFSDLELAVEIDVNNTNVTIPISVDIDFEVFCARCGGGLCHISEGRLSRRRNEPQVTVGICESCYDEIKDEGYQECLKEHNIE